MKKILLMLLSCCILKGVAAQMYVSSGATVSLSGNAQVTLQNTDLTNNGTITVPGTGRFVFKGNANNVIGGSSTITFGELEIVKTGSGLLTLQSDIAVTGKIVFTSNLIELNQHNIDLGSTGILEGENENSRLTGSNGGEVRTVATLNAPSAANPGNLGAVITSSQNMGITTIHRGHQSQTNIHGTGSSILRYYDISPANNTALDATLRINYFDAEKNSLDENDFLLYKSDDHVNWTEMGQTARSTSQNWVELSGIHDFSRWTLSTPLSVIPVTGLKLSGQWKDNAAYLKWVTETEYNNSHFNIQRKYEDDISFLNIGRKNSLTPGGNADKPTSYSWTDYASGNKGPILYRIQQQSLDGQSAYSNIITVKPIVSLALIQNLYPTIGVRSSVYLAVGGLQVSSMQVQIYDMNGRLLMNKRMNYESQWLTLPQMASGHYKVVVRSDRHHWEGSFVKE